MTKPKNGVRVRDDHEYPILLTMYGREFGMTREAAEGLRDDLTEALDSLPVKRQRKKRAA